MESLRYKRGSFEVLDQLLLPHETKFLELKNTVDAWTVIRTMQVRGAPLIAITAALGLAIELESKKDELSVDKNTTVEFLVKAMEYLRTSRPTAVNLFTAMDELTALVASIKEDSTKSAADLVNLVIEAAEKIYEDDILTNKSIGLHGANKILEIVGKNSIKVLTICNTGSLATAGYGTALGVVRALRDLGKLNHVYALETRPYNQGARLTSYEIVEDKLPGTLITDSMASALMAVKGVDVVVVGADRVAGNGDTANKIGTYQLAIAAKYHHVPFFVAAPTTTLDLSMASGAEIHVEERPGVELTSIFGQKIAPDGIAVWNPAFDVTPCSLIRGIITELGVIEPELADPKGMSRNSDPVIPVASFLKEKATEKHTTLLQRIQTAVEPISVPIGYDRMDVQKIAAYVFQQDILLTQLHLTKEDEALNLLKISEVGDGNLNFVYIIEGKDGAKVVVKQALPYVRCVGEGWPLTLQRASFETQALSEELKLTGGKFVPEVFLFDHSKCLIAMRFVEPPHLILRKHLIANVPINSFAKDLGEFLGYTLFGSSGFALSGGELRKQIAFWSQNIAMCALTEKVIFSDPYTKNIALNSWTKPYLNDFVDGIQNDILLKQAASYHKQLFLTHTEALLHGDLHTGSVMAMEGSTFVIDPEFAFYGPMGFDVGALLSNLYLAYFSKSIVGDDNIRDEYSQWILTQIELVYNTFITQFLTLWNEAHHTNENIGEFYLATTYTTRGEHSIAQKAWLTSIYRDTLGFIGSKMLRRIIGIAHVEDLKTIEDDRLRSIAEKRALLFARTLILASYENNYADQGLISLEAVNEVLAESLFTTPEDELLYPETH